MALVSKNVYINKLDDIVNKYNNTFYNTVKIRPVDVKSNTYIDSSKDVNDKNPKFKVGDTVTRSRYKNIFAKGYITNWSEEVFVIKKVKTQFRGHMLLIILMEKTCLERFTKTNSKK